MSTEDRTPVTPQTTAGRRMLSMLRAHAPWFLGGSESAERVAILAIEAEAAAGQRDEIRTWALERNAGSSAASPDLDALLEHLDDPRPLLRPGPGRSAVSGETTPFNLWQQAGGDRDKYLALMREHGHLIPGKREPGTDIFGHPQHSPSPDRPAGDES